MTWEKMNSSCTKKVSFSHGRNLVAQNFVCFENKKCNYKISCSLEIVELFALHLVVYFVFRYNLLSDWKLKCKAYPFHLLQPIVKFYTKTVLINILLLWYWLKIDQIVQKNRATFSLSSYKKRIFFGPFYKEMILERHYFWIALSINWVTWKVGFSHLDFSRIWTIFVW